MSDLKREISKKYNVLTEDGVALRGLFIVDKEVCLSVTLCFPCLLGKLLVIFMVLVSCAANSAHRLLGEFLLVCCALFPWACTAVTYHIYLQHGFSPMLGTRHKTLDCA